MKELNQLIDDARMHSPKVFDRFNIVIDDAFLLMVDSALNWLNVASDVLGTTKTITSGSVSVCAADSEAHLFCQYVNLPGFISKDAVMVATLLQNDVRHEFKRGVLCLNIKRPSLSWKFKSLLSVVKDSNIPDHIKGLWMYSKQEEMKSADNNGDLMNAQSRIYAYFCRSLLVYTRNYKKGNVFHPTYQKYVQMWLSQHAEQLWPACYSDMIKELKNEYGTSETNRLKGSYF